LFPLFHRIEVLDRLPYQVICLTEVARWLSFLANSYKRFAQSRKRASR